MALQIIQVNFNFHSTVEEFENAANAVAPVFAQLEGLIWKTWLINHEKKEAGGIYLFASEQAVENYKSSVIFSRMSSNPNYSNLTVKQFDIVEVASLITNAPVGLQVRTALN